MFEYDRSHYLRRMVGLCALTTGFILRVSLRGVFILNVLGKNKTLKSCEIFVYQCIMYYFCNTEKEEMILQSSF